MSPLLPLQSSGSKAPADFGKLKVNPKIFGGERLRSYLVTRIGQRRRHCLSPGSDRLRILSDPSRLWLVLGRDNDQMLRLPGLTNTPKEQSQDLEDGVNLTGPGHVP
jgi:hypothetical protein